MERIQAAIQKAKEQRAGVAAAGGAPAAAAPRRGSYRPVAGAVGPSLGVNLNGAAFDRQAWVGLVTPIGGFLMGRQYTPGFEAFATFDQVLAREPDNLVALYQLG